MGGWSRLGVIAGGGELPVALAEHCAAKGQAYFVARVAPYADAALGGHPGTSNGLGAMGARIDALRTAGCDAVVLVGQVPRPDFAALELDDGARAMLPALIAAAPQGDDALLRALLAEHERAGFRVLGVEEVMGELLATAGVWGAHEPNETHLKDMRLAARVAAAIGAFDVGQGVVSADGLILAVEAQEGTDAVLRRVAELPHSVRGTAQARRGVLVKRPKPIQERRIDLPTIGVRTIEAAAAAGLAGVAVEAGGALAVRRDKIIAAADRAGLFLYGFRKDEVDAV
jgi:UDP-2,3-diacylglucosamine hydrolase